MSFKYRSYLFFAGFFVAFLAAAFFLGFFFVVGSPPLSESAISIFLSVRSYWFRIAALGDQLRHAQCI